jgi:hypothetical protein
MSRAFRFRRWAAILEHARRHCPGALPSATHRHAVELSSPDAPGMPAPSGRTAWDFMPADWISRSAARARAAAWRAPAGFVAAQS